ncbi:MAG TPA: HlyD family type I secretion periplasmic adaptor subunit [Burkholderiales bacterium]|nr:HlyD family type I secretion periplasmic adaptor subunit [Burkholderiales bacterium]
MRAAADLSEPALAFAPDLARIERAAPSPLPRTVLYAVLSLLAAMLAWAVFGKLDIVAVSEGKLVPQTFIKIVQPAEAGIVREILVAEGARVAEGDVLVRMDSRLSELDVQTLKAELARRRLQLRRIDAELKGGRLGRARDDPPELASQVAAQLEARRQAYLDALGAEQAVLAKARHDLASASEIEAKLMQTTPILREQESAWNQLAREGYAGRLLALDRQKNRIEAEQELKAQSRNVEGLKATIAQAGKRIAQIESNYRRELHNERAEAEAQYDRLKQDSDKQQHRHALLELRAPQAGIVKDLATHTPGTVLAPGAIVLTLVPQGEPLIGEVWVNNADAGFVRAGQSAKIKVAAYPFQKYGTLEGTVRQVSADAQDKSAAQDPQKGAPPLAYRALIALGDSEPPRLPLVAGMHVTAEVHIGKRTVLEYLLSPVQKVAQEAARER